MMGQPIILLFVHDPLAICAPLLAEVTRHQDDPGCELTILVVACGDVPVHPDEVAASGLRNVVIDEGARVTRAYGCAQVPSAMLIGVDGRAVDRAHGVDEVRRLLVRTCGTPLDTEGSADQPDPDGAAQQVILACFDEASRPDVEAEAEEAEALRRYLRDRGRW
jgi:hypothetical protein